MGWSSMRLLLLAVGLAVVATIRSGGGLPWLRGGINSQRLLRFEVTGLLAAALICVIFAIVKLLK